MHLCVSVRTHRHTDRHTNTHTHRHTRTYTYTQAYTHACIHTCIHTHVRVHTYACTHVHTYTHAHTRRYTHMHADTHAHTQIHTQTQTHTHTSIYTWACLLLYFCLSPSPPPPPPPPLSLSLSLVFQLWWSGCQPGQTWSRSSWHSYHQRRKFFSTCSTGLGPCLSDMSQKPPWSHHFVLADLAEMLPPVTFVLVGRCCRRVLHDHIIRPSNAILFLPVAKGNQVIGNAFIGSKLGPNSFECSTPNKLNLLSLQLNRDVFRTIW